MLLAVLGTLASPEISNWGWIVSAIALGFIVGVPLSWVPLTAVALPLAIYASAQTHSWLLKACEHLGLGRKALRLIGSSQTDLPPWS